MKLLWRWISLFPYVGLKSLIFSCSNKIIDFHNDRSLESAFIDIYYDCTRHYKTSLEITTQWNKYVGMK
jgi:hypothetical protein